MTKKVKSKKAKKTSDLARLMIEPLRSPRYRIDINQILKTECIVCGVTINSVDAVDAHFKEMKDDPAHLIWKIMNS